MRPSLLLNENFPAPALKRLRAAGWDVLSVSEASTGATDSDVMELARSEGRWLVTFDRDYGELVFRQQYAPPPVVLLLRPRSYRPEEPAAWIEILYADSLLIEGYFHIFDGRAIRRRPFLSPAPATATDVAR